MKVGYRLRGIEFSQRGRYRTAMTALKTVRNKKTGSNREESEPVNTAQFYEATAIIPF